MQPYKNLSGSSGVQGYELGDDFIKVWFLNSDKFYVYNYVKPGKIKVMRMKKLAVSGKGLSTYISRNVRDTYYE